MTQRPKLRLIFQRAGSVLYEFSALWRTMDSDTARGRPSLLFRFFWAHCAARLASRVESPFECRLRALGDAPILLRPGSSDLRVVRATFLDQYHLPPPEVQASGALTCVWDLGANIGLTMADIALRYPAAHVYGVELDSDNARVARENLIPWTERCNLIEAAVHDVDGSVAYRRRPGNEDGLRVAQHGDPGAHSTVRALSLNALLRASGSPLTVDYVKMDIEGAEARVLRHNTEWAERVTCISVEVHSPYTVIACAADLERLGFVATRDTRHSASVFGLRRSGRGA